LDNVTINTWKTGVERALKKYIPDGTKALDHKCGECGDPEGLVFEEGCLKCKSCGHSKCG
jgi:ribonucleoside-diphosphate reductase alpha chain